MTDSNRSDMLDAIALLRDCAALAAGIGEGDTANDLRALANRLELLALDGYCAEAA